MALPRSASTNASTSAKLAESFAQLQLPLPSAPPEEMSFTPPTSPPPSKASSGQGSPMKSEPSPESWSATP
eukprot:3901859-Rhodomonas_salina.1